MGLSCRAECFVLVFSLFAVFLALYSFISPGEDRGVVGLTACYYLTGVDTASLLNATCAIIVVEPEEASAEAVAELTARGVAVLAYVNAGYAEEWRSYWSTVKGAEWVHGSAGYEGEYFVEYWRTEWVGIVRDLATKYVGMGYSGVSLDNIDAAEIVSGMEWAEGVNTSLEMVKLVCSVREAIEGVEPSSKLYVNIGGAYTLLYDGRLLSCIDGVLREELWRVWLGGNETASQSCSETLEALDALEYARLAGKTVIVSDPVLGPGDAVAFCTRAWSYGFLPVPQPAWLYDYSGLPPSDWCQSQS